MKNPTVRDIARHAGVSVATVSRVTKNDPKVAPATRDRVMAVITELQYRPSELGRALATQRHGVLGLVLPGLSGPYFAELMSGAESVTLRTGSAVLVLGTHLRADSGEAVRRLASRTDALVVVGGTVSEELLEELSPRLPIVVVAGLAEGLTSVRTDGVTAVRELVEHLIVEHSITDLRFVGFDASSPDATARYQGFQESLESHGLVESAEPIVSGLDTVMGARAARRLHNEGTLPRALVCANDELAVGMIATLPGLGHRIPENVAVVGFDDLALAADVSPTLTTVHHPVFEIGVTAAEHALAAAGRRNEPAVVTLPTRLVIRESCGCAGEKERSRF
ncbi:LacI family DNA-binding transcriptional regulator [Microbacterium sp. BK668]|uniref:LacI family DNA-binding transcriptional regulator n=1 Tax=Microbacterium sp. BK668 TaxID=2512118 RepID=UPI00105C55D0|nr:LacI family DNA-binding transcriptional regulator [Microbacterium sp. BK668]TDN91456.1 LacI family transcriptional regulator [Microbacterium sp. BK668]